MSDKYVIKSDVEFKKNQDALGGYTSATIFRGAITLCDVAILAGCTTALVVGTYQFGLAVESANVLNGILSGAVAGASVYVAPKIVKNMAKQVSAIKEYNRMHKLLTEQQDEYASRTVNELDSQKILKR